MADSRQLSPSSSPGRKRWAVVALVLWPSFIFGTSCTVVRPQEFFDIVSRVTGAGRESMERFAIFWGVSWFAVVKGWHFTEFVILTVLTSAGLSWLYGRTTQGTILLAMILCMLFAASDEWHQTFVPDRFGTIQDVMIDSLGVCTAGAVLLIRSKHK